MQLIDTHAHIYDILFKDDLSKVIKESIENNVHKIYMPNIDINSIESMLAVTDQYPNNCFAMMGIHPCYIKQNFIQQLYHVEDWLSKKKFVAIGEIGMDLFQKTTYKAQQKEALNIQLLLAKKYKLPIVIHCRNAFNEVIEMIEHHQDGTLHGIMHCFSSNLTDAKRSIEMGFYLGIGGIVTINNSGLDTTVTAIDLKHIVLETDSPYLAPNPYRGKRNQPSYLSYIAKRIALIKNTTLTTVAQITSENAERLFGLRLESTQLDKI